LAVGQSLCDREGEAVSGEREKLIRIFTVDVEEYFDAENVLNSISSETLNRLPHRVAIAVHRLLDLLGHYKVRATFFILGWIAEKHPELVREIQKAGHEIASHGYRHIPLDKHTPASFEEDLGRSVKVLSDITGEPILGYRATSFSLQSGNAWFFDILRRVGITYDSSAAASFFRPSLPEIENHSGYFEISEGILEFPVSYARVGPIRFPLGGGYFRAYPYWLSRWGLDHPAPQGNHFNVFYIHPWELDPEQPRLKLPLMKSFRHYVNLETAEKKLRRLLDEVEFDSLKGTIERLCLRTPQR
jgi:polysaccharide deacetylase family protein (PEP-CTERM system associated)